jgi:hypothetical protein
MVYIFRIHDYQMSAPASKTMQLFWSSRFAFAKVCSILSSYLRTA